MQIDEQAIAVLIDDIWMATLGMPTRPVAAEQDGPSPHPTLDGLINIAGDWQGTVAVQVPRALAEVMAARMFRLGDRPASLEDMQDALGEITNMTGGNIKALLPGQCVLSLPAVVEGQGYTIRVPSSQLVTRMAFECDGHAAVVSLMAVGKPAAPGDPSAH